MIDPTRKKNREKIKAVKQTLSKEFVRSIERWRMAMNIEKFVFVAHSWGAFLASSYALLHADKIEHLILTDPWGFDSHQDMTNYPWWKLVAAYGVRLFEGCFSLVRIFGPFGQFLIKCIRPDLLQKFDTVVEPSVMLEYIYHCVNNTNPTGKKLLSSCNCCRIINKFSIFYRRKCIS